MQCNGQIQMDKIRISIQNYKQFRNEWINQPLYQSYINLYMSICNNHPQHKLILICLESKCIDRRLCCILCADQYHIKHELISIPYFYQMMQNKLQINRNNPDKSLIVKQLNKSKADIMQRLQTVKNKLIGSIGACEDKVEQYYSKIFHSFAIDSHEFLVNNIQLNFTSQKISEVINKMKEFENITLGSISDTISIMYSNLSVFKQKMSEAFLICQGQMELVNLSFDQFTIAKPKEFAYAFSRQKKSNLLGISDCQEKIIRINGSGGYPMCLVQAPFNPINKAVIFSIDKIQGNKKSICLGVCLQNVVKTLNYSNCAGFNKGIYAIDQNSPYNLDQNMLASWNHHDTTFNQTNVGSNNLVVNVFLDRDGPSPRETRQEYKLTTTIQQQPSQKDRNNSGKKQSRFKCMKCQSNQMLAHCMLLQVVKIKEIEQVFKNADLQQLIVMNQYYYQKIIFREKCIDKYTRYLLKKMSWNIIIPKQVRDIIKSYIYPSFYCHPQMYVLLYQNIQLQHIQPIQNNIITEKMNYMVEAESQISEWKAIYRWKAIKSRIYQSRMLFVIQFKQFVKQRQKKRILWFGSNEDVRIITKISESLNQILAIYAQLNKIVKKNMIAIETPQFIYFTIQKASINQQICLQFNQLQQEWVIKGQLLLWQKGLTINRKRHWIRYTFTSIYQVQGHFNNHIQMSLNLFKNKECIQYLIQ